MTKATIFRAFNNVSDIVFQAFSTFSHAIFTTNICGLSYYLHSTGKEPEAQTEIPQLSQGHSAGTWQSWNSNLGLSNTQI